MAVKIVEYKLTNKGFIVCPLHLTKVSNSLLKAVDFRADSGANRTHMSIYSLMNHLDYRVADIRDRIERDPNRYSVYADGIRRPATFIKVPEIWFLGKCFRDCPVYLDGEADFEKIENKVKLGEIEGDKDGSGNLLGLEILTRFKLVLNPEIWYAEFYSIESPLRDICEENDIEVSSMEVKENNLNKNAQEALNLVHNSSLSFSRR